MTVGRHPPPPVRWWEELHIVAQIALLAPVAVVVLWAAHVYLLNQPLGRGLAYAVFWGLLATAILVGASRSERARRPPR